MLNLTRSKQQKLGIKIGIAFSLVALILIGTLVFTLYRIHETDLINRQLSDTITPQLSAALNMQRGLQNMLSAERDFLISRDNQYRTQRDDSWNKLITPFSGLLQALLNLLLSLTALQIY